MTFGIKTLSVTTLYLAVYAVSHYVECRDFFFVMLNVVVPLECFT